MIASLLVGSSPAVAAPWTPEPAAYAIAKQTNVPVSMADGTVLRADVYSPTDPHTGQAASGPFPVIMVQTPYGKDTVGAGSGQQGGAEAGSETGEVPYLIQRGYIDVVAEVRGTGDSQGTFNLLDPVQGQDGATLVKWAAGLAHSNGRVGLYGPSYMGLNQFLTADHLGLGSPVKALFPIVAGNDTYRDIAFGGGIPDGEFDLAAATTIFGPLEEVNPLAEATSFDDLVKVEKDHVPALASYNLAQTLNIESGADEAYDAAYWQARAPRNMLARVVANGIPAYMVGGYFDLYQRGEPLDYSGLQNAYSGRPVGAPMAPHQPVTGRYQLLQGPWYHLTVGPGYDIYGLQLAWFDRWLKDEPTGIDHTSTPLHLYELGANRWVDAARYPLSETTPTTFYLSPGPSHSGAISFNDGSLAPQAPSSVAGQDQTAFTSASSPCQKATEQWGAGAGALAFQSGQLPPDPCTQDDRSLEGGPGALTYTTTPFSRPTVIAGPIDTTIFATSTRPDTEFVANVEDVSADGTSTPISSGALLGSFRALDAANTWLAPDGKPLAPYHPYTQDSVRAVSVGEVTRYDIEVYPTVDELLSGHRLRLTLTTSDTPHLLPIATQLAHLEGGIYQVQRNARAASFLEVALAPAGSFPTVPSPFVPSRSPLGSGGRHACVTGRRLTFAIHQNNGRVTRVRVLIGRRILRSITAHRVSRVSIRRPARSGFTVRIEAYTVRRKRVVSSRRFSSCRKTPPRTVVHHQRRSRRR